jgi:LmbE family N-acetylglucosaminyl deacetylase
VAAIVVLSPHSDDGILSLGASMARWARRGSSVVLLTVFALDPDSRAETGGWDRRGGFATEGEAALARREEDRRAAEIVGATPVWLPFGSVDFDRHGSEEDVAAGILEETSAADLVLVPGSPLTHPDHALLHRIVATHVPAGRLAEYAEQPYTLRERSAQFAPVPLGPRDRLAKWRALRAYRSQLPLLALKTARWGPLRLALAGERIDWPDGGVAARL